MTVMIATSVHVYHCFVHWPVCDVSLFRDLDSEATCPSAMLLVCLGQPLVMRIGFASLFLTNVCPCLSQVYNPAFDVREVRRCHAASGPLAIWLLAVEEAEHCRIMVEQAREWDWPQRAVAWLLSSNPLE
jgi:hypothetical protein